MLEGGGGGGERGREKDGKYASDVAVMFGADEDITQRDVRDIVELEISWPARVCVGGRRGDGGKRDGEGVGSWPPCLVLVKPSRRKTCVTM